MVGFGIGKQSATENAGEETQGTAGWKMQEDVFWKADCGVKV